MPVPCHLLLAVALLGSLCAHAEEAAKPDTAVRIVALGDSITKGARPARGSYPAVTAGQTFSALLQQRLRDARINAEVINAGIGGNRTDQGMARLEKDVLSQSPQIVLVMFGTNDSCYDPDQSQPRISADEYEANLRQIVSRLQSAGVKPVLMTAPILGTQWDPKRNIVYEQQGRNGPLGEFMQRCRDVAQSTKTPLIDHFANWSAWPVAKVDALLPDGCHPNADGHAALADAITPVLLAMLADVPAIEFKKIRGPAPGGAVLGNGDVGRFDAKWTTCPSVIFDGKQYRMWYSAYFSSREGVGGIGLARSDDGINWTRENGGQPVFTRGPEGGFDSQQAFSPEVHFDGKVYRMWYTGQSEREHDSGIVTYQIGLATSEDGIHWTRGNEGKPVLEYGPAGAPDDVQAATPSIIREKDGWRMWYAAWSPTTNHTICTAKSEDGIHWTREAEGKPVEGLKPSIAYGHSVTKVGDRFYMLYQALSATRNLYGAVSDDGRQWTMLNGGEPVISTSAEKSDFDADIVGHPYLLPVNGKLRAWYIGFNRQAGGGVKNWNLRIGLAEANLPAVSP